MNASTSRPSELFLTFSVLTANPKLEIMVIPKRRNICIELCQQCACGAAYNNINEISERGDTGSRETMRVSRTAYET